MLRGNPAGRRRLCLRVNPAYHHQEQHEEQEDEERLRPEGEGEEDEAGIERVQHARRACRMWSREPRSETRDEHGRDRARDHADEPGCRQIIGGQSSRHTKNDGMEWQPPAVAPRLRQHRSGRQRQVS